MTIEGSREQIGRRLHTICDELNAVHSVKFTTGETARRIKKLESEIKIIAAELGVDLSEVS